MSLDVGTAVAVIAFVALICGGVLLYMGRQFRAGPTAALFGCSNILLAAGALVLVEGGNYTIGILLVIGSAALGWVSFAAFRHRRISPAILAAGVVLWLAVDALQLLPLTFGERTAIGLAITAAFIAGSVSELWLLRRERLSAVLPLLVLVVIDFIAAAVGAIGMIPLTIPPVTPEGGMLWIAYGFVAAYVVGTAVFLIAMIKERAVREQEVAAGTDALTGLPNRGALMRAGALAFATARQQKRPLALVVFDLDRFKSVNDGFGHHIGDVTLQRFCDAARRSLRATDLVGRIGGEEFVAILPGAGREVAFAIAERIRTSFAEAAAFIEGKPVKCTVSSGIALVHPDDPPATFEEVLMRADAALYDAKRTGRDRISIDESGSRPPDGIIRIA